MEDLKKLGYARNVDLKTIIEDGFKVAKDSDCEGFEYTVGKVLGGNIKVSFEPDLDSHDIADIDGVDGFGFCMVYEK